MAPCHTCQTRKGPAGAGGHNDSDMSMNRLWQVTCKRTAQKVPAGAMVEIIKSGTSAPPSANEIKAAIKNKYGIEANEGLCNKSYFDMVEKK